MTENDDFHEEVVTIKSEPIERTWAIIAHIGGLFGSFFVPLTIWFLKREFSPLVDHHGREALNFHLTMLIGLFISGLLTYVVVGFLLLIIILVYEMIVVAQASMAANRSEPFQYPYSIHFIK